MTMSNEPKVDVDLLEYWRAGSISRAAALLWQRERTLLKSNFVPCVLCGEAKVDHAKILAKSPNNE